MFLRGIEMGIVLWNGLKRFNAVSKVDFPKWDALRDLLPFVQFKKCEKHPWRSNFTKSNTPPWLFFDVF